MSQVTIFQIVPDVSRNITRLPRIPKRRPSSSRGGRTDCAACSGYLHFLWIFCGIIVADAHNFVDLFLWIFFSRFSHFPGKLSYYLLLVNLIYMYDIVKRHDPEFAFKY